jgi:hypothetical protein
MALNPLHHSGHRGPISCWPLVWLERWPRRADCLTQITKQILASRKKHTNQSGLDTDDEDMLHIMKDQSRADVRLTSSWPTISQGASSILDVAYNVQTKIENAQFGKSLSQHSSHRCHI